ncbi:hypothetical protein MITS9509_02308 [Synechococcus sp. MIT S9509]|nr:hypothetical protein MITS9509_02308 [Synechococcus sp. MIT S9509]
MAPARMSMRSLLFPEAIVRPSTVVTETEARGPRLRWKARAMKFMTKDVSGAFALELTHLQRKVLPIL